MGKNDIIIIASEAKKAYLHANKRIIILPDIMTEVYVVLLYLLVGMCVL